MSIDDQNCRPARVGQVWVNPHNNQVLNGEEESKSAVLRHYFSNDFDQALKEWAVFKEDKASAHDAKTIVEKILVHEKTNIHEVYFPDSRIYLALILENRPNVAAIWIHYGYVDHKCALDNSDKMQEGYFYQSKLPNFQSKNPSVKNAPVPLIKCPNDQEDVPTNGSCYQCGWMPSAHFQ